MVLVYVCLMQKIYIEYATLTEVLVFSHELLVFATYDARCTSDNAFVKFKFRQSSTKCRIFTKHHHRRLRFNSDADIVRLTIKGSSYYYYYYYDPPGILVWL